MDSNTINGENAINSGDAKYGDGDATYGGNATNVSEAMDGDATYGDNETAGGGAMGGGDTTHGSANKSEIEITGDFSEIVSFAMQQNHVPVVRQLVIKNLSDAEIRGITATISTDPDIAFEWSAEISSIMPGCEHSIEGVDIRLSTSRLFGLTERINGSLTIEATCESGAKAQEKRDIAFLSYDEWSGAKTFPELLSAFVTPNHPYVTEVIKGAGELLYEWAGSPSLTGYQSKNPNNVKMQMAAIYGALQKQNIVYCAPPASFEETGQKVRLGDVIKEQKLATCLDLALLYAGCLEAAGLNPMIVLIKEHAFAGCWLEEESFAECVQDDVTVLTKRIVPGINEICVVETTAITASKGRSFDEAVAAAENHLRRTDDFIYLVDVKRSRGSGIRPIPQKRGDGSFAFDADGENARKIDVTGAPEELEALGRLEYVDSINFTRQQMWERKLLDLSLRNSLLSFRVTKNAIQLLVDSLHDLEDALSGGEEFQILHKPQDMANSPRDNKIYESENKESIWNTLIRSEFKNHRIRTYLDEISLSGAILNLYRSAKSSMEENGANTLYLAMGFLKWYESILSEKPRYAPLIMIPIDIVRKSAQRGYIFRLRDEEPQFNVTLLEMLRMNYGITATGLDPLPTDEMGIDIKRVFHIVRQLIMDKPRWDVEELAFMGVFSFSQFIMWNDIRNRVDDLRRNKVVKSLISGQMEWESDILFPSPQELDDGISPAGLAVPIGADSSQLAAVYAAGQGKSFVLHGPPGTGKSQTITNIIANALYQGKTVLFVAEKMAALTVVEKRLNAIGLGDFCLELHSNKARKKDVLGQLEKALGVGRIKPPEAYSDEADAILGLRRELNGVIRELHKPRNFGFSVYDAVSRAEQYKGSPDCIKVTDEQIRTLSPQQYSHWEGLSKMLSAASSSCGGVCGHALEGFKNPRYSQGARAETEAILVEYMTLLPNLGESAKRVADALGLGEIKAHSQFRALSGLGQLLSNPEICMAPSAIGYKGLSQWVGLIASACTTGQRRDAIKRELCSAFSEQILGYGAESALLQWNQAAASWFLPKMLGESKISKSIRLFSLNPKGYNKADTPKILEAICEYHKAEEAVRGSAPLLNSIFGAAFNDGNCDWLLLERVTGLAVSIQGLIGEAANSGASGGAAQYGASGGAVQYGGHVAVEQYGGGSGDATQYSAGVGVGVVGGAAQYDVGAAIQRICESLGSNAEGFVNANRPSWDNLAALMAKTIQLESELSERFENPFAQWHNEPDWLAAMSEKALRWIKHWSGLRDYCGYLQVKSELDAEGMQSVYHALENGAVKEAELPDSLVRSVAKACAVYVIDNTPILSQFRGDIFVQKIEKFKELSEQYEMLTRQELAARLSAQIPVLSTGVSGSSEIGILQRAIKSGGRMMPVRKLFESIPNLLRRLCPCMLMSPISVAQYLDPKYPAFDLVVFDEASQLPTSEAVGAIARGSELVVVGDPKQLPPTSFFTSNQLDEDNYDKEDLESVLDDCLALSMPQERLIWHYRSRHESLIAFSNKKYYENKLRTFPSPNDMASQVRLISVDGFYDRGKTKQNAAEAEAVVAEIIRRLSDPAIRGRSIGVVTFSSVQQALIADMLEAEFAKHPDLDEYAHNMEEPIFIKNLENVQGDERDVILFSIGYGPDKEGRVALNFGPLNRDGGWRRLNVAVTRARHEMLIFSVLKPEQIDLNRTGSDGVAGLKAFLEFAGRGGLELPEPLGKGGAPSDIAGVIAGEIRKLGYSVHTGIGSSGFQVDIGVVCPGDPNTYALGILCDGKNYFEGCTASDRNRTQEAVLKGLGWNISRVWALDWWENPEKELSRIASDIDAAINLYKKDNECGNGNDGGIGNSGNGIGNSGNGNGNSGNGNGNSGNANGNSGNANGNSGNANGNNNGGSGSNSGGSGGYGGSGGGKGSGNNGVSGGNGDNNGGSSSGGTMKSRFAEESKLQGTQRQTPMFERIEESLVIESLKQYAPVQLKPVTKYLGNAEFFAGSQSTGIIIQQIHDVLEAEAPICKELLCKRVLEAWGISRMGARIGRRFEELFSRMRIESTICGEVVFYWNKHAGQKSEAQEPHLYDEFRAPSSDDGTRRNMENIPPEEIASAVKHVLNQQIGLLRDDLEREVSRIFGFARCTEAMQKYIQAGIESAVIRKWAEEDGSYIRVL